MKRREFLKRLFGIGVGAAAMTVPGLAKAASKETFTLDEAFIPHDGNELLYYIKKDSILNKELMKVLGDRYLPKDKFGCYRIVRNQYLPIKDEYTIDDFKQLIMFLEDKMNHFEYFCDGIYRDLDVGLLRLYKVDGPSTLGKNNGYYELVLFQAFKNGQYGPKD